MTRFEYRLAEIEKEFGLVKRIFSPGRGAWTGDGTIQATIYEPRPRGKQVIKRRSNGNGGNGVSGVYGFAGGGSRGRHIKIGH